MVIETFKANIAVCIFSTKPMIIKLIFLSRVFTGAAVGCCFKTFSQIKQTRLLLRLYLSYHKRTVKLC